MTFVKTVKDEVKWTIIFKPTYLCKRPIQIQLNAAFAKTLAVFLNAKNFSIHQFSKVLANMSKTYIYVKTVFVQATWPIRSAVLLLPVESAITFIINTGWKQYIDFAYLQIQLCRLLGWGHGGTRRWLPPSGGPRRTSGILNSPPPPLIAAKAATCRSIRVEFAQECVHSLRLTVSILPCTYWILIQSLKDRNLGFCLVDTS